MDADKIIFPTDLSPLSNDALKLATSLARDTGAKLIIVHVEEPATAYGGGEAFSAAPPTHQEQLAEKLRQVTAPDPAVPVEHRLLTGDPAAALVRLAEEENADYIVMATHGRRGLSRLLMGSVAEAVVRRAPCPVLTLKPKHDEPS